MIFESVWIMVHWHMLLGSQLGFVMIAKSTITLTDLGDAASVYVTRAFGRA